MMTQERKTHILAVLERDGRVIAKAVSQALGLSEDTIRRDLVKRHQEPIRGRH